MNPKTSILLAVFLTIIMLSSTLITGVNASTEIALGASERGLYINCGISGWNTLRVNRPQLRTLVHSTEKTIIVGLDSSSRMHIKVISSVGVILADTLITTPTPVGMTGAIAEYDASNVLITCSDYTGGTNTVTFYFIKYNIITFTPTAYSVYWVGSGASAMLKIGQLYYYSGVWYAPALSFSYSGGYTTRMCKFTVATSTASSVELSATAISLEMGFQDPDNLKMLYLIGCGSVPKYYKYDCTNNAFSLLATNPFSGEYPDLPAYANMMTYLGGGIYQDGTFYYVYHSWIFSWVYGDLKEVKTIHWTGQFNNSITSGTLINQVRKEAISWDSSFSSSVTPGISWGWLYITPASYTQDVYTYYQDISGGKYISRDTFHITDITAMYGTYDTVTTLKGVDGIDFTYKSYDANIACLPESEVSYQEVDNANSYLYIGEIASSVNYSESFAYFPLDTPLKTGKYYTLTWTIYKNGILDYSNDTYQFKFDGVLLKTGTLDNGKAVISIMVNTSGYHAFQIIILDGITGSPLMNGIVRPYTFTSTVTPSDDVPPTPILIGYYSDIFMVWLPISIIVLLPMVVLTILGGKFAGGAGAIAGMMFGGVAGVVGGTVTGIIPMYALYLLVILIATTVVILFTRNTGGAE